MRPHLRFLALLIALLSALSAARAQNALSISGYVVDPTGAALPKIPIQLQTTAGVILAEITSDSAGAFRLTSLRSGDYVLNVPAFSSFAERSVPVHLATSITSFKLSLSLAAVTQQVTVSTDQTLSIDSSENKDTVAV